MSAFQASARCRARLFQVYTLPGTLAARTVARICRFAPLTPVLTLSIRSSASCLEPNAECEVQLKRGAEAAQPAVEVT